MQSELDFCPILIELINVERLTGRTGKVFENLGARSTVNDLNALRNLFIEYQPERTLEIGLSFGASTLLFTSLHQSANRSALSQHVALDPYQSSVWDDAGIIQLERAGLNGYLDFRQTYSCFELPRLLELEQSFDFVYIDGSHLFEGVFIDTYYSARLLTAGGIIAFDDCPNPHAINIMRFLQKNCKKGLAEIDLKPFRPKSRYPLAYDFAKLISRIQMRAFRRVGSVVRPWNTHLKHF